MPFTHPLKCSTIMLKFILSLMMAVTAMASLTAQLLPETFDADLTSGGFTTVGSFVFSADGTAAATPFWRNRSRLRSASEGGAALFEGLGNTGRLTSPQFDANGTELYLSFYHYLRTDGGQVQVQVLGAGGVPLFTTIIVPNLQAGEETSAGKFEIIDISEVLAVPQAYQVEFSIINGNVISWLVDDIATANVRPAYPTFPRYVGEQLTIFGEPFVTDSLGAPAVPYELVIDFTPGTTPAEKDNIRQQLGAIQKETCVCDRLEVWELPGGDFFDPTTGEPLGDPGEILERKLGSGPSGNVDNIELNLLNYQELQNVPGPANAPLTPAQILGLPLAPNGAVKIAVLDSGLDLDHPALADYVFRSSETLNGTDDDNNCYADDVIGWNFVDNNNNPSDDHSHGTHVAGIVAQNLASCDNCTFQIIPYKTHSSFGVGTLFATACATLQASVNDGASVINASWGFYGGGSDILRAAIDTAGNYGSLVIAAAGNDSLNLVADFQYPATSFLPEVISVGTFSGTTPAPEDLAAFSNYNPLLVDVLAPGIAIVSSVPDDEMDEKTGTSMSTPAVAAGAALHICDNGINPVETKSFLLDNAGKFPGELGAFVSGGNVLNYADLCSEPIVTEGEKPGADFSICLLQSGNVVDIRALRSIYGAVVQIVYDEGGVVATRDNVSLATGESLMIDISDQPAGNYLVVIQRGDRTIVQRLAKP